MEKPWVEGLRVEGLGFRVCYYTLLRLGKCDDYSRTTAARSGTCAHRPRRSLSSSKSG